MGYAAEDTLQRAEVPGHRTTFDDIDFIPDDHRVGPNLPELRELLRWFREHQPTAASASGPPPPVIPVPPGRPSGTIGACPPTDDRSNASAS